MLKMIALQKRRLVDPLEQELAEAVDDANDLIAFVGFHDPRHSGMGTTLTAVALSNDGVYLVANVGDSRTYLMRETRLHRLTRDDSLVQQLIDQGLLTESEARQHPQRSVVLQALDGGKRPVTAARAVHAKVGDRLLLCSDGLSDYLQDAEIAELLRINDARTATRQLIDSALGNGSRDNITAVIADVIPRADPQDGWLSALPFPAEKA